MATMSLEETLRMLAPDAVGLELSGVSPSSKKSNTKKITKKSQAPRSPVKLPVVTPVKNADSDKIEIINSLPSLYDADRRNKNKPDTDDKEDFENINEKEEPVKEVAPHTPTRVKMASPRTPLKKFSQLPKEISDFSLKDKLHEYRYTVLKYILDEKENNFIFVVCFNPNGQLIFVDIKDMQEHISVPDTEIISVNPNHDDIIFDGFQTDIISKVPTEVTGIVFYDGISYLSCIQKDDASVEAKRFDICDGQKNSNLAICHTFMVIRLNELMKNPDFVLDSAKKTYQIIQQQQLLINKNIIENVSTSINNLSKSIQNFNNTFQLYAKHIADDWTVLGAYASKFYYHYGKQNLDDIQKETFDKISANMFARFQNFNEQLMMTNHLNDIVPDIDRSSKTISQLGDDLEINDIKYKDKILNLEDLNITV